MANSCPEGFASIYASIFAGGIPCGIYTTSSPEMASYICKNASADILLLDDLTMLVNVINKKENISNAFPGLKCAVLINANEHDLKEGQ